MAVAPFEIIAGPAKPYVAPVGTAFPLVDDDPAAFDPAWIPLGETEGGVTVRHTQTIEQLRTDQHTGPVKAIRTEEGLEIEFGLAELTIENFSRALGIATVNSDAGGAGIAPTKSLWLKRGVDVNRFGLLVRGPSPYGDWNMQWEVPVVIQSEEPEVEFVKDDKSILSCVWVAMEDLAAPEEEQFGRLVAQSAITPGP